MLVRMKNCSTDQGIWSKINNKSDGGYANKEEKKRKAFIFINNDVLFLLFHLLSVRPSALTELRRCCQTHHDGTEKMEKLYELSIGKFTISFLCLFSFIERGVKFSPHLNFHQFPFQLFFLWCERRKFSFLSCLYPRKKFKTSAQRGKIYIKSS